MVSPSACRMGLVSTTRRKIGTFFSRRSALGSQRSFSAVDVFLSSSFPPPVKKDPFACTFRRPFRPLFSIKRWQSSTAAVSYDSDSDGGDDLEIRSKGFAAAQELRTTEKLSRQEAWMINLGRDNDNEWLTGPREEEWFTGVHPLDCPGTYQVSFSRCMFVTRRLFFDQIDP